MQKIKIIERESRKKNKSEKKKINMNKKEKKMNNL